jgi:hypothetical protein
MKFAPSVAVSSSFLFIHRAAAAGQPSPPMTLEDFRLPQADTGVLVYGGFPSVPDGLNFKAGAANGYSVVPVTYPTKGQVTTDDVVEWQFHSQGGAYLDASGNLYTCWPSSTNAPFIGRSVTPEAPADEYHLAATGVASFLMSPDGIAYVNTSGELYYCGVGTSWGSTGTSYYTFTRVGSDSDWISIHGDPTTSFSATVRIAQKGSSAATAELYVIGSNNEGKTGQNTTSGSTTSWSKMSDGASGTFDVQGWTDIKVSTDSPGAIDSTGKLYRWGEGQYGAAGVGTSTDILVPTRVGLDSDWEKLGTMRNVMMAIKGGEIWYCSAANYGSPGFASPTYNRFWQQLTSSGGNWEDIKGPDTELSTSSWLAKYNGTWLVYGISPDVRGRWSSSALTGSSYTGTGFTELSNHPDYPAGSPTINWVNFHAFSSTVQILLLRAT